MLFAKKNASRLKLNLLFILNSNKVNFLSRFYLFSGYVKIRGR